MNIGAVGALLTVKTKKGQFTVHRPDKDAVERTKKLAKEIFVEAFTTTYTEYYKNSKAVEPIEKWLGLREGLTINQWLENTFDGEYEEYLEGKKQFVHLYNDSEELAGWISHEPVSATGEMYLSQCSLEAKSRGGRVSSTVYEEALRDKETIQKLFPGVKVVKLIAREINEYAKRLYKGAGFTVDLKIDPKIYGPGYNDRYIGFRKDV